ncbi:MAG: hypothetical protein ABIR71_02960 [Chthoniobacterales bacterium]
MKTKITFIALLLSTAAVSLCLAAADPFMGTWKLNESKSKIPSGASKLHTVVYAGSGDKVTVTVDSIDPSGKAVHQTWSGKLDGKPYPVKGDPSHDARAYTQADARTITFTVMKAGKEVGKGKVVLAADGKSRTVTQTLQDAKGKSVTQTAIYDKQ